MVLFKRKPVQFLEPDFVPNDEAEVWLIPQTGEVFVSYEDYLTRNDLLRSFQERGKEIEESFPEQLKGPVLRKVQFRTTSRLDTMVDEIYAEFKSDYFPGEEVTVIVENGERLHGLVRDKARMGPRYISEFETKAPTTRYMVSLNDSKREISVFEEDVSRDRGVFTKSLLRSFIKRTTIRESWTGAPWLVKHDYANRFRIDTRIPPHLRLETKREERKQIQAQKRASHGHDADGHAITNGEPVRLPDLKPGHKEHQGKHSNHHAVVKEPTPPPPPPPIKYPIEDLEIEPKPDRETRPEMRFMCKEAPLGQGEGVTHEPDWRSRKIEMQSVGGLLETWDTLNVYCEIFKLDSFTFDDFVEAMIVASEEVPVQLFDEVHCAVLKILVDSERDGGKVRITLPEIDEEDSDEEDEEEEESQAPTPEPEPKPAARATRSSLAKLEAEKLAAETAAAEEEEQQAELATRHRAEELLQDFDWIEKLRERAFANGGWQMIVVGLLYQLSKDSRHESACDELLLELVPPGEEPSQESVLQAYSNLDVNLRVRILQMICMLTMETKTVRGYMEECSDTMTKYRKERIEWQRQKKQALEELRQLNEQRKILLPDNMPPSPPEDREQENEEAAKPEVSTTMDADETVRDTEKTDDEVNSRKKRRSKQQKLDEARQRKKEKAKKEKAQPKPPPQSKAFIKLLKEIAKKEEQVKECEEEVGVIENDLREADCPRTRVLGKDRFWNRYYWFERNGMPYGGLPTSSTAHAGYANGCIWIQGPDDIEREGFIDLEGEGKEEHWHKFGHTVKTRKENEEGKTRVFTAHQWGYISKPEDVDKLINWLDIRGVREKKLKQELYNFRDKIVLGMKNREAYLAGRDEQKEKEETKRSSSRIREKTPEPPNHRCLAWENSQALEDLGHLHSEPPPRPRARKQAKKREAMSDLAQAPAAKKNRR
ncbi:uncharacterized protein J7T54_000313 [Emericellopsis cladophorae]|uniref:DDT domain-containing protein n=1 Tax=Emericellopsis cladophorae TaxID=2686198 RepID=A0A9Q0BBC7_9HYPO|nr:uncharacterized protein J7T54_000313 [Emericellopsis cladophorae]KAI6779167.1 hypothetical protein J7T54_000313 [Emericellopsis cladophorae]